jgi:cyclic pyranopterin phosphate synthase
VRKGIMTFFRAMSRHLVTGALKELTLTTNGSQLRRFAAELAECGVRRVNVSLDTIDEAKFRTITRWGRFAQVMDGIDAAQEAGLRVKINTVALRGMNDDEVHDLVAWCSARGFDLTFIEVMPMGDLGNEDRLDQYYSLKDLRRDLEAHWTLTDTPEGTGGPARYVRVGETGGRSATISARAATGCG